MTQALKKLSIVISILILLGYVGNLLLDNPYVHSLMRKGINHYLTEYTYMTVKFEAVGAKLFPPALEAYGIELSTNGPDSKNLPKISHLKLKFALTALFMSRKEILDLEINEPHAELPLPPLEKLIRLEKFPKVDDGPPTWPPKARLPFYRIAIINGRLSLNIEEQAAEIVNFSADGIFLELLHKSWKDFSLSGQAQGMQLRLQKSQILRNLSLQFKFRKVEAGLHSDTLHLKSPELEANGQASILFEWAQAAVKGPRKLGGIVLQLDQKLLKADMAILGRFLGIDDSSGPVSGPVQTRVHIPFDERPAHWLVQGSGSSKGARLMGFKLLDSTTDFKIDKDGMTFAKSLVKKGERTLVKGDGYLGFKKEGRIDFNIFPVDLSLAELLSVLKVDDFNAIETKIAPSKIRLSGQSVPFKLVAAGDLIFEQLSFPFVKELPDRFKEAPTCAIDSHVEIDSEKVSIKKADGRCHLNAAEASLKLGGDFSYSIKEGMHLTISSPDLKGPMLNHYTKLESQGTLDAKVEVKGSYDNLAVSGKLQARDFDFSGFPFRTIGAQFLLPVNENRIKISELSAQTLDTGTLQVKDLSIGFCGKSAVFHDPIG